MMTRHHSHSKPNKFTKVAPPQEEEKTTFVILCMSCVTTLATIWIFF
jgi:hypothetical protein